MLTLKSDSIVAVDDSDDEDMPMVVNPPENSLFCGFASVEEFSKVGLQRIVEATKCANTVPSGASRDLYSAYPSFGRVMAAQSNNILRIISSVVKYQNIKGNIVRRDNDEKFELLQECNDVMLERLNSNLDIMAGIKKAPENVIVENTFNPAKPVSGSWNDKSPSANIQKSAKILTTKFIAKPQINFKTRIDNSNSTAFEPKITNKPNSLKPLAVLPEYDDAGNIDSYLHPYEFELNKFEVKPKNLKPVDPRPAAELDDTPMDFISNDIKLNRMMDELRGELELAVDVEHHSYRTFQGITCLLQISTRTKDYIIDTIALREELQVLNEIFTNPNVVKVFHGADSDIQWLQRDLSLYIVNMFDTHQAAKSLGLARLSLAYLMKNYCKLEMDKTYQLADWRYRPLPQELIEYARKDTHYLLYIYDFMKNELLKLGNGQPNILISVYQNSTELCKIKYVKPRITDDSFMDLYRKSKRNFDNRQLHAFKEIFLWRDRIARQEDESYGYVLPNHMMLQIAESVPREIQGILACCNPIPSLVRQHLVPIHQIILKAREQPLVKPITEDQSSATRTIVNTRDINSMLNCPHDLSHMSEFRDDLPTLLNNKTVSNVDANLLLSKSVLSVFDTPDNSEEEKNEKFEKIKKIKFLSPYKRYKLILPFAEQQRLEELEKENKIKQSRVLCPEKAPEPAKDEINTASVEVPLREMKKKGKRSAESETIPETQPKKFKKPVEESESSSDSDGNSVVDVTAKPVEIVIKSDSDRDETAVSDEKQLRKQKFLKKKKQQYQTKNITQQSSGTAVAFDYANVDFKRFQGGSQQGNSGEQVNTKFHGKGKNNKRDMKKFNKMFSFSKINNKK